MKKLIEKIFYKEVDVPEDMIKGEVPPMSKLYKETLKLTWPAISECVLLAFVSITDTFMVSALGTTAIAAIGITTQPKYLLLSMFFALNIGVTAVVARRVGQQRKDDAVATLRASLTLCLLMLAVIATLGFIFAENILLFAGAQSDTIVEATAYFKIIILGIPFTAVSLCINAAHRGAGNTKISMRTNITANAINIVFNYLLIGGNLGFPALGITGAAIATTLGYVIAFCMSVYSIFNKKSNLRVKITDDFLLRKEYISPVIKVSSGAAVEQLIMRFGFMSYTMIIAGLGTVAYATHQIAMSVQNLTFAFADGFSISSTTLMGQSLGRKRPDLGLIYGSICKRISMVVASVLAVTFFFCSKLIVMAFSTDAQVIADGTVIFMLMALIPTAMMVQIIYAGCLRGAGDTKYVAFMTLISIGIMRPALSYLFCYPLGFGVVGAWIVLVIDQYTRRVLTTWRFSKGKWMKIKL